MHSINMRTIWSTLELEHRRQARTITKMLKRLHLWPPLKLLNNYKTLMMMRTLESDDQIRPKVNSYSAETKKSRLPDTDNSSSSSKDKCLKLERNESVAKEKISSTQKEVGLLVLTE